MSILANDRIRLIITGKCNLDCFYCHNEGQEKEDSFLQPQILDLVETALTTSNTRPTEITISGGEPLMHNRVEDIVRRSARFADRVTLVSNGLLATKAKLESLANSGLQKLRLGIDSLRADKPRPSPGYLPSPLLLPDILSAARYAHLAVDLNVVVTKFNRTELGALAVFAIDNGLSIKFFEHVEVASFGAGGLGGKMAAKPHLSFDEFVSAVASSVPEGAHFAEAAAFGEANLSCHVGPSEIRYCRYLCNYDLCWLTGTRLDALGYTYNCMVNRGLDRIRPDATAQSVLATLASATARRCREPAAQRSDEQIGQAR